MPAVLLDENMALRLVDELQQRGFDVITIKSLGLNDRKTPDAEVFAVAVSLQRILITHNHAPFENCMLLMRVTLVSSAAPKISMLRGWRTTLRLRSRIRGTAPANLFGS